MFSRVKPQCNQETHDAPAPQHSRSLKNSQSSKSTASSSDGSLTAPRASFRTRLVKSEDEEIAALAMDTKLSVDWKNVVLSARVGPSRWRLKEVVDTFAVYTRQESQRFEVLSVGIVPGCAAEIVNILQSRNSAQYEQRMQAVFEDQFKEGSFVHSVDIVNEFLPGRQCKRDGSDLSELSVKTVTFNKSGWLANHEEWCYVDAVYRNATSGVMEKHMTSLSPSDIVAGLSGSNTKYFQNVTCSYWFRPGLEDDPPKDPESNQEEVPESKSKQRTTRVTFYGGFLVPKQLGMLSKSSMPNTDQSMLASEKTVKQRLVKLAESTSRLIALVRRQRLGMQVLIDHNRFLPPTNVPCHVCTKMLVVAKQCRLCGQGICGDCSSKHERAKQPRGSDKLQVMRIRVCATCLERVDQALYANIGRTSVLGPQLLPDADSIKQPANLLKDLLHDALLTAPSPTRKACVMSVIKCVLNQETADEDNNNNNSSIGSGSFNSTLVVLSPSSSELDHIQALDFLQVERVSALSSALRSDENRNYKFDSTSDPATTPVPTPVPENEAARLLAVRRLSVAELSTSQELEILCQVAATEMGCASSIISIIDSDTYYSIASNTEGFRNVVVPRSQSMCSHTMMETSGFMVRHPEADIRFSKFASVDFYGVRYYCAFPITGDDGQIIGTMCCVNDKSVDVTESQFSVFKKLAATASKIVRVRSAGRARGLSTASSSTTSNN